MAQPRVSAGSRGCLSLLAFYTLLTLGAISAFAELQGETRSRLALAVACTTVVLYPLMSPLFTRPPAGEAVPRTAFVARTGRLVMALVWLIRSAVYGFAAYLVTDNLHEPGFHARVAALSVCGQLLSLLYTWGSDRAGFPVDWSFLRGLAGVRRVLSIGVAALIAGYAATLAQAAETGFLLVPAHLFQLVRDLGLWSWLALLVTVLLSLFAVFVLVLVESALQHLAALALGKDNTVGSWLEEHLPARIERTEGMQVFHFDFFVHFVGEFDVSRGGWFGQGKASSMDVARMHRCERGMSQWDEHALRERVFAAMARVGPAEWRTLRLDYHAVADHEELVLTVNPAHPASDDHEDRRELSDFAERDALRRLRAAHYTAGYGAPFSHHFSLQPRMSSYEFLDEEPPWLIPPTREQYRADLKRFPVSRRARPQWLRVRLRRLPW